MCDLEDADMSELAISRKLNSLTYSRRCAEASAVQAYQKRGMQFASGMEIGYVVRDAAKGELSTEKRASEFDAVHYGMLLEKAWDEVAFVLYSKHIASKLQDAKEELDTHIRYMICYGI